LPCKSLDGRSRLVRTEAVKKKFGTVKDRDTTPYHELCCEGAAQVPSVSTAHCCGRILHLTVAR